MINSMYLQYFYPVKGRMMSIIWIHDFILLLAYINDEIELLEMFYSHLHS